MSLILKKNLLQTVIYAAAFGRPLDFTSMNALPGKVASRHGLIAAASADSFTKA